MVPVFVAASRAKSRIIARTKFFSKNSKSPQSRFSKKATEFDVNLPLFLNFVKQTPNQLGEVFLENMNSSTQTF